MVRRLIAVGVAALALAAGGSGASAATVSLSPLFFSYHLDPGATQPMELAVANPGTEELELRFESDVYPSPADGGPLPRSRSLEPWLYGPTEPLRLPPNGVASVPIELRVPLEAAVGSYYGILAARVVRPSGGIAVAGRVAAVVLVNVGSPLDSSGRIVGVDLAPRGGGWAADVRYENTGNAHFVPSGTVAFRSWPSGARFLAQLQPPPILPGTVRSLPATVPAGTFSWGAVVARTVVVDGNGVIRRDTEVYVPPIVYLVAVLTAGAIGSTLYVRRRKRTRNGTP